MDNPRATRKRPFKVRALIFKANLVRGKGSLRGPKANANEAALAGYMPDTRQTGRRLRSLANLRPDALAVMHGSSYRRDLTQKRRKPMSKPPVPAFAAALNHYEKLIAASPEVERKGAAMPYTSVNGHMFSFLTKTGRLALRLPEQERDAFLKKFKTTLCEQNGAVLKEYVEVPDALFAKTRELKGYFDTSYAYVASLKPKPTKKKS
jgi:hypothetical protein